MPDINIKVRTTGFGGGGGDTSGFAGGQDVGSFMDTLYGIGNMAIYFLISLAVVFIVWHAVMFIKEAGGEKRGEYQRAVLWGIVGLAVILSIWGIVNILGRTFGLGNYASQAETARDFQSLMLQ